MKKLMQELLDKANIPALSLSWCQEDSRHAVAYGKTDTSAPSPVDTNTLFQAASLSKPVSAAIILDLVDQGKWNLDTPLADIADYGPPELRQDPHYRTLTTRMVIGQYSGLANYGQDGDDGTKFIATPNTRFTYSGVALDFLQQVIEKDIHKKWEDIAQDFFTRANMKHSTFRQLPDGRLNGTRLEVAKAHLGNVPLPPLRDDGPGVLAGGLLTTAEDYISFLQYCFKNDYFKSTLLTGTLSGLPPTISPETSQIQWGLGIGVYSDLEKTIAFHWGNNPGSISFCAMDMKTGDSVVSFSNSMNGPFVFQQVAEPIVGDIKPLFQWLSDYCNFKDSPSKEPDAIVATVDSILSLARKGLADKSDEEANRFKQSVQQVTASGGPGIFSKDKEKDTLNSTLSLKPPQKK